MIRNGWVGTISLTWKISGKIGLFWADWITRLSSRIHRHATHTELLSVLQDNRRNRRHFTRPWHRIGTGKRWRYTYRDRRRQAGPQTLSRLRTPESRRGSRRGWDEIAMQRGETSVEQVNSMRTRISAAVESAADNGVGLVVVFRIESTEGAAWGALGANVVTGAIDARDSSLSRTLYTHGRNGANAVQRLVQTTSQRQSYNNLVLFGGPLDASAFSTGLERAGYAPNQCKVFTTQYSPSTERHSN